MSMICPLAHAERHGHTPCRDGYNMEYIQCMVHKQSQGSPEVAIAQSVLYKAVCVQAHQCLVRTFGGAE